MVKTIYEDEYFVVCNKPASFDSERMMVLALKEQCKSEIYPVHRLDTIVSGIMVYAKTKESAAEFSKQILNKAFKKEYIAVVSGVLEEKEGTLRDYIFKDSKNNKTYVAKSKRKGVKEAILNYKVLDEGTFKDKNISLVHIFLETGRTHQIRVQFASRKHPLIGDGKYGSKFNYNITLWSYRLSFLHPKTKENLTFALAPADKILNCFKYNLKFGEAND